MAVTEIEISPAKKMETDVDADDDDVSLCFRSKRKSTANVVHDDDDDAAVRRGKRGTKNKETHKKPRSKLTARIEAWLEECEKLPPLSSDEEGELDISGAALVEIDGPRLKERDQSEYDYILSFAYSCRQKCELQLFRHPGDPRIGGLGSATGRGLTDEDRDCAVIAIKEYQKVNKNAKLKLRDLMKANLGFGGGVRHYLTFSAEDEVTGEIKAYQAALAEHFDAHLLGLFRDIVDDKVLAILSVKGTEEDLTADEDEFWRMWEERLAKESNHIRS